MKQFLMISLAAIMPLSAMENNSLFKDKDELIEYAAGLHDRLGESLQFFLKGDSLLRRRAHRLATGILDELQRERFTHNRKEIEGEDPSYFWYLVNELRSYQAIYLSQTRGYRGNAETQQKVRSLISKIIAAHEEDVSGNALARAYGLKTKAIIDDIKAHSLGNSEDIESSAFDYFDEIADGFVDMDPQWRYKALLEKADLMIYLGLCDQAMPLLDMILAANPEDMFDTTLRDAVELQKRLQK